MAIEVWFPLALYYHDMEGAAEQNPRLLKHILALREHAGQQRTGDMASWTGDIHRVDRLHHDPEMEWLTGQVARHAEAYLRHLGHDMEKCAIHIQRGWPVVALRNQRVARHAHHTAHLSAVYYVAAPQDGDGGKIEFFNDALQNEIQAGIGSTMTEGYAERNALNYGSTSHDPIPGRLLLFPSKLTHAVAPNQTDEARVSVSFDLVVTSRGGDEDGGFEFLMPAPGSWRQVYGDDAPGGTPSAQTSPRRIAPRMTPLDQLVALEPGDEFSLPELTGHVLWEPKHFAHCSSRGGWTAYRTDLDALLPEDWFRDHTGRVRIYPHVGGWKAAEDASTRLVAYLRAQQVPLLEAAISGPQLQHHDGREAPPFQRLTSHLGVYLRVDFEESAAAILFEDGERLEMPPGMLAIVPGVRRHRVDGAGYLVVFRADLPTLARAGVLGQPALQAAGDATAAAALMAQPLDRPLPSLEAVAGKRDRHAGRDRRRARFTQSPGVQKFLKDNANPAQASAEELAEILQMGNVHMPQPPGAVFLEEIPALTPDECAALRSFADTHITAVVDDTVDDLPEYQLNMTLAMIRSLLGAETTERLLRLPEAMGAPRAEDPAALYRQLDIFVRLYAPDMRPFIPFHHDTSDYTANVALTDDGAFAGGSLLVLRDDGLRAARRSAGRAVLHAGHVVHGVSGIEEGTRYALILFFHMDDAAIPVDRAALSEPAV